MRYRVPGEKEITTQNFDAASAEEVALLAKSAQLELTSLRHDELSGDEREAGTLPPMV